MPAFLHSDHQPGAVQRTEVVRQCRRSYVEEDCQGGRVRVALTGEHHQNPSTRWIGKSIGEGRHALQVGRSVAHDSYVTAVVEQCVTTRRSYLPSTYRCGELVEL